MALNDTKVAVWRGKASYAKILGDPVPNFGKDGFEWKMDLEIDKSLVKEAKALGIADKVKEKDNYLDGRPHVTFKQKELKRDWKTGEMVKADPIKVTDILNNPWPQDRLIGNGSVCDVKFTVKDYGPGKKSGFYINSVRVLDHVPYEREEFSKIAETDEYYVKAVEAKEQKDREDAQFKKDFNIETPVLDDDLDDVL